MYMYVTVLVYRNAICTGHASVRNSNGGINLHDIVYNAFPVQVKRAMANTSFVMSTASKEQATDLQERLVWVKSRWEGLSEKLKRRRTQLMFEKAEKVHVHVHVSAHVRTIVGRELTVA